MEIGSVKSVAQACGGKWIGGVAEATISRIATDSRHVQPGDLFVALRGERFDGHDYLSDAAEKGAVAVVVERARAPKTLSGCAIIAVNDTRKALGRIAAEYRSRFTLPVIAVGGSNGKTTTKELIASVLRQKFNTLASEASFNNDIGVPLTMLRLEESHEAAVMEVGTNHPGELAPLVQMIQPRYGVITNIGREHLEFFGDLAGVALEEGRLAELLPADGKLFVNGDNEWTDQIAGRTNATVVRVGLGATNDWSARNIRLDRHGAAFHLETPLAGYSGGYRIRLMGRHQVVNALFTVAIGAELGVEAEAIERGLAACEPPRMRLQIWDAGDVRILDDAYNANADSVGAALETLHDLPCKGRRIAVLGDMAELGRHSEAAHEEVGRRAAELGIAQLIAVGKMAGVMAAGARAGGLNRVLEIADVASAASALKALVKPGDMVLLKASRASHFEQIGEALRTLNR